jgi:hypothetical protein
VNPFTIATIGFCDAYLYCKGVLLYTLDDKVRILDVHNSKEQEIVFSIPGLLNHALSNVRDNRTGHFQILYYSDGIVSCVYRSSTSTHTAWLISFSLKHRNRALLLVRELDSTEKLFVRHNGHFLYYGTHSDIDADGHKKWMIYGYEFRKRHWFDEKIYLSEMAGSDIGSTVCFEIFSNYFYALSNQTSFEVEEIDWTSFYHCVRFPLDSPCKALMEKTRDRDMWRRQHQEGPIDERWMSLQLVADESSGELKIVESRKEWYLGSSKSQRNYYTSDIIFPHHEDLEDDSELQTTEDGCMDTGSDNLNSASTENGRVHGSMSAAKSVASGSSTGVPDKFHGLFDNNGVSNSQLLRLIKKDNNPHYLEAPPRLPHETHPGDDGSAQPTFTLAKTRVRTYHLNCSTFLDLVDDPAPTDCYGTQRLRLRGASRRLGPLLHDAYGLLRSPSEDLQTALKELYVVKGVEYWPPSPERIPDGKPKDYSSIYRLLNPSTHLGEVEGTSDDRSLVYVTGARDKPRALIFVGFDPAIRFKGLRRWGQVNKKKQGVGEGPHVDGRATGSSISLEVDEEERYRTVTLGEKGKGRAVEDYGPQVIFATASLQQTYSATSEVSEQREMVDQTTSSSLTTRHGNITWIWREKAMYQDIQLGYNLGIARKMRV